jgi:hypothetical protein
MPYVRRNRFNAKPGSQAVYADPETEKILLENGFVKASGAPYYNRGFVNVAVFDDGTWEPSNGEGFLPDEWRKMRQFEGVQLKHFASWLTHNHQFIDQYCANFKPEDYRAEEAFVFVKVYKDYAPPFGGPYVWFIQHFTLLGSDDVMPADKRAIPRQYWFIKGKYYESMSTFTATGIPNQFQISQTADLEKEMTDPYVVQRIGDAFIKQKIQ